MYLYIAWIYKYINKCCFVFVIYEAYFLSWFNSFFFPFPSSFLQLFWLFIASFVCFSCVFYCLMLLFSYFLPTCFLFFLSYSCAELYVSNWLHVLCIIICLYIITRFLGCICSSSTVFYYLSCAIPWLFEYSFFLLFVLKCLLFLPL